MPWLHYTMRQPGRLYPRENRHSRRKTAGGRSGRYLEFATLCVSAYLREMIFDRKACRAQPFFVYGHSLYSPMVVPPPYLSRSELSMASPDYEHEAWFAEFLAQGPSGHFRRRQVGESPFVSKFLHP
jgi:hypothetical protein